MINPLTDDWNQFWHTHFFTRQEILGGSCAAIDDDRIRKNQIFYPLDVSVIYTDS